MNPSVFVRAEVQLYLLCPECGLGEAHSLSHLPDGTSFGPWYCHECGWAFRGRRNGDGADIQRRVSRLFSTLVTLRRGDMDLVVEGVRFEHESLGEVEEHERYYYEEHTCPTNYLRSAETLRIGDDDDPHGAFDWVKTEALLNAEPDYREQPCDANHRSLPEG